MPFITSPLGRSIEQPISARLSVTQSCLFFRLLPQELRDEIHIAVLMNDHVYHPKPGAISVLPQGHSFEKVPKSSWSSATFKVKISESDFGWLASCRDNHYEVSKLYFRFKRFYFADPNVLANFMVHSPGYFRLRQNIQHLDLRLTLDGGMTKLVAKIMDKMPSLKTLTVRSLEDKKLIPTLMDMNFLQQRFGRLCDVRGLRSLHFADAFDLLDVDIRESPWYARVWYWRTPKLVSDGDVLGTLIHERVCLPRGTRIARSNEVGEGAAYVSISVISIQRLQYVVIETIESDIPSSGTIYQPSCVNRLKKLRLEPDRMVVSNLLDHLPRTQCYAFGPALDQLASFSHQPMDETGSCDGKRG